MNFLREQQQVTRNYEGDDNWQARPHYENSSLRKFAIPNQMGLEKDDHHDAFSSFVASCKLVGVGLEKIWLSR